MVPLPIVKKVQVFDSDTSEMQYEDCQFRRCHYISRGHTQSHAFQTNGLTQKMDDLAQLGASLEQSSCGDIVERAACSQNYEVPLSWLIDQGASFREIPGGINNTCCEAYERGDFKRFRWLFSKAVKPSGSHGALIAELRSRRRKRLRNG